MSRKPSSAEVQRAADLRMWIRADGNPVFIDEMSREEILECIRRLENTKPCKVNDQYITMFMALLNLGVPHS